MIRLNKISIPPACIKCSWLINGNYSRGFALLSFYVCFLFLFHLLLSWLLCCICGDVLLYIF